MKVFQIIPNLAEGGAERFVVDLCNQLATEHHEVILCTLFDLQGNYKYFKNELLPDIKLISLNKKLGFDISVIFKLRKALINYKPDIVHTHIGALNYLLLVTLFTRQKYKAVHTVHTDAKKEVSSSKQIKLRYWFYRKKKILPVTISKESDRTFKELYPKATSKVIYNGRRKPMPTLQFNVVKKFISESVQDNTKVFVHIGRLISLKNHLVLISAFKKLLENNANALLIMIGGESDQIESKRIAMAIKEICVSNRNIIWVGGNQPATDYLMLADFFCLSSLYEGMPISLIEAFATGCVPVCTPVGGIPEMMDGNDFLAEDITESAFYNALQNAYSCPKEKLDALKKKFTELFNKRYTMKHCASQYEELYKGLLNDLSPYQNSNKEIIR